MGRPRKPTKVLELNGAFKKDPARRKLREFEPQIEEPLGEPPDTMDESERARWADLKQMAPWLVFSDRLSAEELCRLWAMRRRGEATPADGKRLDWHMSRMGLTASDRSRVKMPGTQRPANKFGELAG
jgi:hypothetical protein